MRGRPAMPAIAGPVGLFALAFVVRLAIVLHSRGGLHGNFGYDSGVYYAAADALIHGRLPYADFTLLHPPALMLTLTPFAFFGTLTSDHLGFVVANTAFEAIGGVNAVLVMLVARRAGVGRFAAAVGGLFYALWPGAAGAEISIRLEPLGNLFLLGGLLLLVAAPPDATRRRMLLCGALFGAAAATKVWWVIPLLVLAGWAIARNRRRGVTLIAGSALALAVIIGPFFVLAPSDMWRMVVSDQLGRPATGGSVIQRLAEMMSLSSVLRTHPITEVAVVLVAIGALVALVRAWRCRELRPVATVAVAALVVLLAAPTYFQFYADFLAPGAALVLAGALAAGPHLTTAAQRTRRTVGVIAVGAIAAAAVVEVVVVARSVVDPFPGSQLGLAAERARSRCVMSDSPMALIELDVLSDGLARGCPNRVDVSGSTYDVDRPRTRREANRIHNPRWQHDLYRYLTSGDAEITIRHASGISPATKRRLSRLPVIATVDGRTLRRVP